MDRYKSKMCFEEMSFCKYCVEKWVISGIDGIGIFVYSIMVLSTTFHVNFPWLCHIYHF